MNQILQQLWAAIRESSGATKATYAGLLFGAVGIVATMVSLASRPHYERLWSGLNDSQLAAVGTALAESGVDWQQSQPPGPYTIYVDRGDIAVARNAMFSSGALQAVDGGILTGSGGMGSVFLSSGEREQLKRKREWEEMENMLKTLSFVMDARVRTTVPSNIAFGKVEPITGSVTLTLRPGTNLSRAQARTAARLVRFGLGIAEDNLVVADQHSETVFDGTDLSILGGNDGQEWFQMAEEREEHLEHKTNKLLDELFGDGLARITVRTDWDYDASTVLMDSADPKAKTAVVEESSSTETPRFPPSASTAGGSSAAGAGSNVVDPTTATLNPDGTLDATGGATRVEPPSAEIATTNDSRTEYQPSRTISQIERRMPKLERISVALWLDQSLAAQREEIARAVKAAVAFDEGRGDTFEQSTFNAPAEEEVPAGEEGAVAEETQPVSPLLELLMTRGVEVVSALAFVVLLFVSLRGGKVKERDDDLESLAGGAQGGASGAGAQGGAQGGGSGAAGARGAAAGGRPSDPAEMAEIDPELLAIRQVEELLATDPERVGKILSSWAREKGMARL